MNLQNFFNKISLVASRRKYSVESPSQYYVAMYRWNHINLRRVDIIELYLQKYKGFLLDGRRCAWHFLPEEQGSVAKGSGALHKLHNPIINTAILANRRFQQARWTPSQLASGIPPKEMDRTFCEPREKE